MNQSFVRNLIYSVFRPVRSKTRIFIVQPDNDEVPYIIPATSAYRAAEIVASFSIEAPKTVYVWSVSDWNKRNIPRKFSFVQPQTLGEIAFYGTAVRSETEKCL